MNEIKGIITTIYGTSFLIYTTYFWTTRNHTSSSICPRLSLIDLITLLSLVSAGYYISLSGKDIFSLVMFGLCTTVPGVSFISKVKGNKILRFSVFVLRPSTRAKGETRSYHDPGGGSDTQHVKGKTRACARCNPRRSPEKLRENSLRKHRTRS